MIILPMEMNMSSKENGEMLSKMLVIATNAHAGQFDKGGKPYILHPLSVMYLLNSDDEELNCVAVGHDLFEDTDITKEYLRSQGFTERVIEGIYSLTKIPGESLDEYKIRVKANPDGRQVKKADLQHNTDIRRLKGVSEKDMQRTMKYYQFYMELSQL